MNRIKLLIRVSNFDKHSCFLHYSDVLAHTVFT